jgi:hypothetical protein
MGKHSAYRESKLKDRARLLAVEQGISFEDALIMVKETRALTMKALKRSGKSNEVSPDEDSATPFTRLKENCHGNGRPLQGGSPGQGKRS